MATAADTSHHLPPLPPPWSDLCPPPLPPFVPHRRPPKPPSFPLPWSDPIAPAQAIPYRHFESLPNLMLATTRFGGHLGWLERHGWFSSSWSDAPMLEFLAAHASRGAERGAERVGDVSVRL